MSDDDRVPVSMDVSQVRAQRDVGLAFGGLSLVVLLGALRRFGDPGWRQAAFAAGLHLALALAGVAVGAVFLWASRHTARRLAAPPAYWQERQDRGRGGVRFGLGLAGGSLLTLALLAHLGDLRFASGLCLGAGVVPAAVAVLMATPAIRPGRYE